LTRNHSPCYAFVLDEVKTMAEDGADVAITHLGAATKGSTGATTVTILEEAPSKGSLKKNFTFYTSMHPA
jgi:predicted TIM-barrel enzyme